MIEPPTKKTWVLHQKRLHVHDVRGTCVDLGVRNIRQYLVSADGCRVCVLYRRDDSTTRRRVGMYVFNGHQCALVWECDVHRCMDRISMDDAAETVVVYSFKDAAEHGCVLTFRDGNVVVVNTDILIGQCQYHPELQVFVIMDISLRQAWILETNGVTHSPFDVMEELAAHRRDDLDEDDEIREFSVTNTDGGQRLIGQTYKKYPFRLDVRRSDDGFTWNIDM